MKIQTSQILTGLGLLFMIGGFFSPIWWVSLTAPNYPKDTFPDGIKIHFSFTGVSNGCSVKLGDERAKEIYQGDLGDNPNEERNQPTQQKGEVGLDCVHEMNTINHYVGMYPIATGAPVELKLSPFVFGMFAIMLITFLFSSHRLQIWSLSLGFSFIAVWMGVHLFVQGGAESIVQSYQKDLGQYFNDPEKISIWGENIRIALYWIYGGILTTMILLISSVKLFPKSVLLLPVIPALLPFYFIADFSAWLWFFGHNLHPWGAFTLKPFMPTVFGEGKVAQFSTYSFPHYGFFFLVLTGALLLLAILFRMRESYVSSSK